MIDINQMAAFFHNGQCWYSVSVDTQKTGDPNFGGSVIWNFSVWSILMKWQPFFNFFIMANCWYSISIDTQKTGDPNFGEVSNLKFSHTININEMAAIFQFFDNGQHWHSVSVDTQKNWRPKLWGRSVIWNFSVWLIITWNGSHF